MIPPAPPASVPPARTSWPARFQKISRSVARATGHPLAFVVAMGTVLLWAFSWPLYNSGNSWLLVINTITNIATFLMIFLIRNAQNRESEAVQLKLDELIRATKTAHNSFLDIEELSETDLDHIKTRFERLARQARETPGSGTTTGLAQPEANRAPTDVL